MPLSCSKFMHPSPNNLKDDLQARITEVRATYAIIQPPSFGNRRLVQCFVSLDDPSDGLQAFIPSLFSEANPRRMSSQSASFASNRILTYRQASLQCCSGSLISCAKAGNGTSNIGSCMRKLNRTIYEDQRKKGHLSDGEANLELLF